MTSFLLGLICLLVVVQYGTVADAGANCMGLGNTNESSTLLFQFNDTFKQRYSTVNTGVGCFTGLNYNYKYYSPMWYSVTSIGWYEIKSIVWYYVVAVQNVQTRKLSLQYVNINTTMGEDDTNVGNVGTASVKTMDLYANPRGETVEAFFSVFFTSSITNRVSTALYSVNINNNVTNTISHNVLVDLLFPSYPVFVNDVAIICFYLVNNGGIMCKKKLANSNAWQTLQWGPSGSDVLKIRTSGFFPIASSASSQFLGCTTFRESLSKGSNVCFQLSANQQMLTPLNVSSTLPVGNRGSLQLLCGDPWKSFVFYALLPSDEDDDRFFVYVSKNGGSDWTSINSVANHVENAYIFPLLPLKTYFLGTSNEKITSEIVLPSYNESLPGVNYLNVLDPKNKYGSNRTSAEYAIKTFGGPVYFTSFVGEINHALQGLNGRNTVWHSNSKQPGELIQGEVRSQICFRQYQNVTSSSFAASSLVQGVVNTNEADVKQNAQIVGASVGVITGLVGFVLLCSLP